MLFEMATAHILLVAWMRLEGVVEHPAGLSTPCKPCALNPELCMDCDDELHPPIFFLRVKQFLMLFQCFIGNGKSINSRYIFSWLRFTFIRACFNFRFDAFDFVNSKSVFSQSFNIIP